MSLATKLQIPTGQRLRVIDRPDGVDLDDVSVADDGTEGPNGLLVFVTSDADLTRHLDEIVASAAADALTWVAYPKGGQLGTDLNRDRLGATVMARGVRGVRQVSIDDIWSALRFRP